MPISRWACKPTLLEDIRDAEQGTVHVLLCARLLERLQDLRVCRLLQVSIVPLSDIIAEHTGEIPEGWLK